jgi:poly-gamma-glutamate synthesis protein (capsule biosynthesis protein)
MESLNITAVGDISMGDHPVCVGHGMRSTFKDKKNNVLSGVEQFLKSSDITMGNLETVVSDKGLNRFWLPSFEMRGDPQNLIYLKEAGIDLVSFSNNHCMQHGDDAFWDTIEQLKKVDIKVIGIDSKKGKTIPYFYAKGGKRHTFFSVSMRPEERHKGNPPYSLREDIDCFFSEVKSLKKESDGFFVCSIHWGLEFLDFPSQEQCKIGRALIDAGVDVVFGHHSHLLQSIERYKNGLIFYSLGNFVFDMWEPKNKISVIANVKLKDGVKPSYTLVPVVIDNEFLVKPASMQYRHEILEQLRECNSQEINQIIKNKTNDYFLEYNRKRKAAKPGMYGYFLRNLYKCPPHFTIQALMRTLFRRLLGI